MSQLLHGIFTVTTTPFNQDGSIDYTGAEKNLEWQIEKGIHGLIPLGATGEYSAMTLEERKEYASFILRKVDGRVPVIVGTITSTAEATIELSRHAAENGASAVMVLTPPGTHASQDEIYHYYKSISGKVSLPVMIYNNPGSSGVDILMDTLERIASLPRMEYIKESTGDIKRLTKIVDRLDGQVTPFCGCEELAYESFFVGARGWVCVIGNIAPEMCRSLYNYMVETRDYEKGWALYRSMLPMLSYLEQSGALWQVVKYAQEKMGLAGGSLRSPRLPLNDQQKAVVDQLLEANPLY